MARDPQVHRAFANALLRLEAADAVVADEAMAEAFFEELRAAGYVVVSRATAQTSQALATANATPRHFGETPEVPPFSECEAALAELDAVLAPEEPNG